MPARYRNRFAISAFAAALVIGGSITHPVAGQGSDSGLPRVAEIRPAPREWGVGTKIDDLPFTDLDGNSGALSDYRDRSALVLALRDTTCPIAAKLGPELARLEAAYQAHDVAFLFINPNESDTPITSREEINRLGLQGRYAIDRGGALVHALRAETTTEVFVLDRSRTLQYRGAINDQFSLGGMKPEPTHHYLANALDAVLNGREPRVPATRAPGCLLSINPPKETGDRPEHSEVTWHHQISRLIQSNCQSCHRAGGVAPFPLETYDDVKARRTMIRAVVEEGIMPPWHAEPGHGPWLHDRSLSAREKDLIREWVERGTPEGDPNDAPVPRSWSNDWHIGSPDLIVAIPDPVKVPASGALDYVYQWVQVPTDEDRWVSAIEVRPSQPQVVHHVLVFLEDPPREGETREEIRRRWQGGLQGYFAGHVPGQGATIFPPGFARKLPAGAWLKFQLHYTANGTACEDRTEIAFRFADTPPQHEIAIGAVATTRFEIPPHTSDHQVVATVRFSADTHLLGFSPHMHLRGKSFRYELLSPDGEVQTLINIPEYDFDWQTMYRFITPLTAPAGSILRATAQYDNSQHNPSNPDPTRRVRFGEQTWDEMMIGYFEYWRDEVPTTTTGTRTTAPTNHPARRP